MRPRFDPRCAHAEPRTKGMPLVLWHYCGVRARDVYNESDCRNCPSHKPPRAGRPSSRQGEMNMPKIGFWRQQDPATGRVRLEIAQERLAAGDVQAQIERDMGAKPSSLWAALHPEKAASKTRRAARAARDNETQPAEGETPVAKPEAKAGAGETPVLDSMTCPPALTMPDAANLVTPTVGSAQAPTGPTPDELAAFLRTYGLADRFDGFLAGIRCGSGQAA